MLSIDIKKQKEIIAKTFGCCRFVYNKYLAKRIEVYEQNKETFFICSVCKG
ncbi:helix-turn-helix domain-containing protein [Acetivibrio ethanolgignens]|uniref:helix-turn-helix domain-containing protein n=1 Tax=Acetivibrio ethanolgignens TaxID=290052 RepID=UPI0009F88AAA